MALLMRPSFYSPFSWFDAEPVFHRPYSILHDVDRSLRIMRNLEQEMAQTFQAIEQQLGGQVQVTAEPKDGKFALKCHMTGFAPEELKCDLDGDHLILTAEHKDDRSFRSFHHRILLPETVDKDSIKCEFDSDRGELCIEAVATPSAIEQQPQPSQTESAPAPAVQDKKAE